MSRLFLGKTKEYQNQKTIFGEIASLFNKNLNLVLNIRKKINLNILESCFLSSSLNAEQKFQILCFLLRYDIVFGLKLAIKYKKEFPVYESGFGRASDKISELLLNGTIILKLKDGFLSDLSQQANVIYRQLFGISPIFIMEGKRDMFDKVWSHVLSKSDSDFLEFYRVCLQLFSLYGVDGTKTTNISMLKESYNQVLTVYLPIIEEIRKGELKH